MASRAIIAAARRAVVAGALGLGAAAAAATAAEPVATAAAAPAGRAPRGPRCGELYTWGSSTFGQTGHGHEKDVAAPRRVEAFAMAGKCVAAAASSGSSISSVALTTDGEVCVRAPGRGARHAARGRARELLCGGLSGA